MDIIQTSGTRFNGHSGAAASGSVSVTQAATSGRTYYVTDISASGSEGTCIFELFSSSTTYWRDRVNGSATVAYIKSFISPIRVTSGSAITARLLIGSAGGENGSAFVNIAGYFI